MEYHAPVRGIQNSSDLEHFKKSQLFTEISDFVKKCADSVVGKKISDPHYTSSSILKILAFLDRLFMIIAEIPPLKQPMRFGNKAFKTFHSRLCEESTIFLTDLFPIGMKDASFEVASYINTAFGNETRIDYGTGHELSFVLFLLCLYKLKVVDEKDFPAMILKCFTGYLKVMRRLHEEYLLEPAGSHGVWGLDDYHCLVFVWGAAQLVGHTEITPISIHNSGILSSNADEYIYLTGIQFIKKIKRGASFAETSPMLNDISSMADWAKVCTGLMRMFQGEVLSKLPVVQHLLFGSILKCTWNEIDKNNKKQGVIVESKETKDDNCLLSMSAQALDSLETLSDI